MKFHIITYGCQMNESDSEKIAARLRRQGHQPAKNEEAADLIAFNCCSVRQAAMHRVYDKINKYKGKKKIILAGCILDKDKKILQEKVDAIWHPDEYFKYLSSRTASLRGAAPRSSGARQRGNPEQLPPPLSAAAYVPIMTGCNNFCSYCAVPFTRGREKSRPAEEIIAEVQSLIARGHKEIMLLGQNVNSYKSTTDYRLQTTAMKLTANRGGLRAVAKLPAVDYSQSTIINFTTLLKIINNLPGSFRLSFLTSHPKDMSDELITAMAKCEKLTKELHLPIQSGDDIILRKMNRCYTTAHYKNLVKKIRCAIPDIKISTDIIVGFPGETKKQFANTVKLCRAVKFNKAFIAKYSPRPGTAAAKLKDDIPMEEKKRRWKILDTLINKFKH